MLVCTETPGENMASDARDHVEREVAAPIRQTLEDLRDLVPGAFGDGNLDASALLSVLGLNDDRGLERYSLSWAGKRDAIKLLQVPTRATLEPDVQESIDFDKSANAFVEGDNLEVLKLLHKSYAGRVKMIYIDPPYNTGGDFIYADDFTDPLDAYLRLSGQVDEAGDRTTSNPEYSGRRHSAWLSMMYPRLFCAW